MLLTVQMSFPSWERGLKSLGMALGIEKNAVVPLVGTWIEMCKIYVRTPDIFVVPLVGTWIEILRRCDISSKYSVVPLVGTWIEIVYTRSKYHYFACRSPRGNVD